MRAAHFYVIQAGKTVRPVSVQQVVAGIRVGKLAADVLVCAVGTKDWHPITHFAEFAGEFAAPPPPGQSRTSTPAGHPGTSPSILGAPVWEPRLPAARLGLAATTTAY